MKVLIVITSILIADLDAQALYAADGGANNPATRLYILDKSSGSVITDVGALGFAICNMAFDPTTGILYGTTGWKAALMPGHLFTIDPATAQATLIGPTITRLAGMTFDASGQLWAWSEDTDSLVRIDKGTGGFTIVGSPAIATAGSGMVFNPMGELWVATRVFDLSDPIIHRIDTATGLAITSQAVTGSLLRTKGMTYDMGGTLYGLQRITNGALGAQRALATINLSSGAITQVGTTLPRMDALAFLRGNPPPSCTIVGPLSGASVGGTVSIIVDADDLISDPVTLTFEHSSDGGATWSHSTPAPGSPLTNPSMPVATPASAATFHWCSPVDSVGFGSPQSITVRAQISDGTQVRTCSVDLMLDNGPASPICTLVGPVGTVRGDIALDLTTSAAGAQVSILVEWSTNGGASFSTATMSPSSPTPNPAAAVPTGLASFLWRSHLDGVAVAGPVAVIVRARVDDGLALIPGSCSTVVDLDNTPLCTTICGDCNQNTSGPDILDALTAAQIAAGIMTPTPIQALCCDVNSSLLVDIIDALVMARSAAGLPVTLSCP